MSDNYQLWKHEALFFYRCLYSNFFSEKKKLGPMQLNGTSEAAKPAPVKLPASERNELAIQVLHQSGVTPEHIETRTLYNDDCPGIPQVL